MKLPSIHHIISSTISTVYRFPLTVFFALLGTVSVIMAIENMGDDLVKQKIIICSALGLTSSLALALFNSYYSIKKSVGALASILLIGLVALYYYSIGSKFTEVEGIRFFVMNVSLHLVVAFVMFIKNREVNEFWSFNKNLFIRIITSGVYSGTLIVGLNFAVLAIDNLFNVKVDNDIYLEIPVSILGVFNTLFFLSGVPKNEELGNPIEYPKGLKSFTQFVLLPLVAIYLFILLAYEGRILVLASLPKGWVSTLILVFSVIGILAMLLVYPLRNGEENKWIKQIWKWYFWVLVPLLALLYWAILYRINLYGFTVERYYVFVLALWLTGITLYSIVKVNYHIRVIPITLALVGLVTLYGPQSASTVAKYSQQKRLRELLQQHHQKALDFEGSKEITSVVQYLYDNYNHELLAEYFPMAFTIDSSYTTATVASILLSEKITYTSRYATSESDDQYVNASVNSKLIKLPDADWFWQGSIYQKTKIDIEDSTSAIQSFDINLERDWIEVTINKEKTILSLKEMIKLARQQLKSYTQQQFTIIGESKSYQLKVIVTELSGTVSNNEKKTDLNSVGVLVFVKLK